MLLSQDHINHLIQPAEGGAALPLDDEEFLTNYVALLKMISVRLSKDTVRATPPHTHTDRVLVERIAGVQKKSPVVVAAVS